MTETADERAERLEAVAVEFASRVREETSDANWSWYLTALPDPLDREALAFILAAAIPVDVPWRHLVRWATLRRGWLLDGTRAGWAA